MASTSRIFGFPWSSNPRNSMANLAGYPLTFARVISKKRVPRIGPNWPMIVEAAFIKGSLNSRFAYQPSLAIIL